MFALGKFLRSGEGEDYLVEGFVLLKPSLREIGVWVILFSHLLVMSSLQSSLSKAGGFQDRSDQVSSPAREGKDPMSKEEAIEKAKLKAKEMKYSVADHAVKVKEVNGKWAVSFVPMSPNQLGGGLVVMIDKQSGEIVSAKYQQ